MITYFTPVTPEVKRHLIENLTSGGRFFKVGFVKANGEQRQMLCKLGVTKYLKGGEAYNSEAMLTVFDVDKLAYRNVNLNTLNYLKCGTEYTFAA